MAASSSDKFTKVGVPGTATTLAAPGHSSGGTSITVGSTSNWPTDTGVIFAIDTVTLVNGAEVRDVGSYTEWEGVVTSSTTIGSLVVREGTDQNYPAGATTRVYIPVSSSRENQTVDGILVGHNQDGSHKTDLSLTTPKVTTGIKDANGNVVFPLTGSSSSTSVKLTTTAVGPTYVESGCIWTADAPASTRNASMSSGVVYINGVRLTVSAVTARTFTASKDTYVDFANNGDGTPSIAYNEVTNNSASPTLAANNLRNAIIVTGASNIAGSGSINQGNHQATLPSVSSINLTVTDSLGNLICPVAPYPKLIGYRQITTDFSTASLADITGLNVKCIIPTGRRAKVRGFIGQGQSSVVNNAIVMSLIDVDNGVQIASASGTTNSSGDLAAAAPEAYTSQAGTRNFKAQLTHGNNAATTHTNSSATNPAFVEITLD